MPGSVVMAVASAPALEFLETLSFQGPVAFEGLCHTDCKEYEKRNARQERQDQANQAYCKAEEPHAKPAESYECGSLEHERCN